MREYWILTKLQMSSLFGINRIRHMRSEEEKKQGKKSLTSLIIMTFAIVYVSGIYSVMLAMSFEALGMLPTLLGLMALAGSALVLMFSIFETKGVLFGFGDYDVVMSWPVSVRAVAASRVTNMYLYNLVYAALFLLPAGVVYAIRAVPQWWYYPLYLALTLLMPALPTLLGAALGTLLTGATARMKKRNLLNIIAQMALVIVVMGASFQTSAGFINLSARAASLQDLAGRLYPPAQWFQDALTAGSAAPALWLLLSAAAAAALLIFAAGKGFVAINSLLASVPRGKRFVMRGQLRSSVRMALYRMERARYFSSSLYVVNTAFGYVMLLAAGIFCVVKPELLAEAFSMPELSAARAALPFVLAWIVSMSTTTGSAISMEGKTLWIVKSMPVTARDWLAGKLFVDLMLAVPMTVIGGALMAIGTRARTLLEVLWLLAVPLTYALCFGVFGLWVNIRMPKLDWQNEAEVVKQSMAAMIVVFVGMGAAAVPGVLSLFAGGWAAPGTILALLALTLWMWRSMVNGGERRLLRM